MQNFETAHQKKTVDSSGRKGGKGRDFQRVRKVDIFCIYKHKYVDSKPKIQSGYRTPDPMMQAAGSCKPLTPILSCSFMIKYRATFAVCLRVPQENQNAKYMLRSTLCVYQITVTCKIEQSAVVYPVVALRQSDTRR